MASPHRAPPLGPISLAVLLLGSGCALWSKVLGGGDTPTETRGAAPTDPSRRRAEEQVAAQPRQDAALQAEVEAVWAEIDEQGITSARALSLGALTEQAFSSGAVGRGHIQGEALARTTIDHIDEALAAEPDAAPELQLAKGDLQVILGRPDDAAGSYAASFAARAEMRPFLAMLALERSPAVDAIVRETCAPLRPLVDDEALTDFVEACLVAANGDAKALAWKGIDRDLAVHRKEMAHRAEQARLQAEQERAQAEEEARLAAIEAAKTATYTVAAVFAAGDCSFGDCMHNGWEIRTDEGTIRVTCSFGECLSNGWEARFPDGSSATTSCSFGKCMTDGWETRFPDGQTARTSCNFGKCATDGWETRLPNGDSARTSCSFGECYTNGWETRLPDGGTVRCSCNFSDCLANGTQCR